MCGRMTLTRSGSEIAEYFALELDGDGVTEIDGTPLRPRHNVAPSQPVPTIIQAADGRRELSWRQWGLIPSWSKSASMGGRLFNARSETASEKPSFRTAWKHRRCLVVVDGFYEWTPRNRDHQPYHFRSRTEPLLAFAGLYEEWHGEGGEVVESCTVLTTEANADLEGVHHRMPVILAPQCFEPWLGATSDPDRLTSMMHPASEGTLARTPVGRGVNNPRLDDPSCLTPIDLSASSVAPKEASREKTNGEPDRPPNQGELFGSGREDGE
jgi:putative SOS response-associated peptidase YedK